MKAKIKVLTSALLVVLLAVSGIAFEANAENLEGSTTETEDNVSKGNIGAESEETKGSNDGEALPGGETGTDDQNVNKSGVASTEHYFESGKADWSEAKRFPEGMKIGNIDIEGMTGEEARDAVYKFIGDVKSKPVEVTIGEEKETFSPEDFDLSWGNETKLIKEYKGVGSGDIIDRYIKDKYVLTKVDNVIEFGFNKEKMNTLITERCKAYIKPPVDAKVFRQGGIVDITPSENGQEVNVEKLCSDFQKEFEGWDGKQIRIIAEVKNIEPAFTTEMAKSLGTDVLGQSTSIYVTSDANRNSNVEIAARSINGSTFPAGAQISTLAMLNPVTAERGYLPAHAYSTEGIFDSIGGGICQVSSTLYNAVLYSELQVNERENHMYEVNYYGWAQDATIFAAAGKPDFIFTNTSGSPIYIEATTDGTNLTIIIYGTETRPGNRTVTYVPVVDFVEDPVIASDVADPSLPPGRVVYDQGAHRAARTSLWKIVTVDGAEMERKQVNVSNYNRLPGIRRYGAPVDANGGRAYYVRDDGYVVRLSDLGNPNPQLFRLNPDGSFLDQPVSPSSRPSPPSRPEVRPYIQFDDDLPEETPSIEKEEETETSSDDTDKKTESDTSDSGKPTAPSRSVAGDRVEKKTKTTESDEND